MNDDEHEVSRTWTRTHPACVDLHVGPVQRVACSYCREAQMMVDSWRMYEQRKHMALMDAPHQLGQVD